MIDKARWNEIKRLYEIRWRRKDKFNKEKIMPDSFFQIDNFFFFTYK